MNELEALAIAVVIALAIIARKMASGGIMLLLNVLAGTVIAYVLVQVFG